MPKVNVPKEIKKAINEIGKYNAKILDSNKLIRDWMEQENLYNDANLDMLIDMLELNANSVGFLKYITSDKVKIGNKDY
ncbi:hypothetical protein D3C76_1836510 [compost metagenome]